MKIGYYVRVDVYVYAKSEDEAIQDVLEHLSDIPDRLSEALTVDSGEVQS